MQKHIFLQNKYTSLYYRIIDNAKTRITTDEYYENHHIIPKSLGGNNEANNLIKLLAREHFICHKLLLKMTEGESYRKMAYAVYMMRPSNNTKMDRTKWNVTSKVYAEIRKAFSHRSKESNQKRSIALKGKSKPAGFGLIISTKLKGKTHLPETKIKISIAGIGRLMSEESKKKMSDSRLNKPRSEKAKMNMRHSHVLQLIICPYCNKSGSGPNMTRYHFSNCKFKGQNHVS